MRLDGWWPIRESEGQDPAYRATLLSHRNEKISSYQIHNMQSARWSQSNRLTFHSFEKFLSKSLAHGKEVFDSNDLLI